jgi:hypothetical protein
MTATLSELEVLVDTSGVAEILEVAMPAGGRPRQLPVRTLIIGILLAIGDDRPAQLTRVHQALIALPDADRRRLGIEVPTIHGDHLLTYRQVERTFASMTATIDPTPVPSFRNIKRDQRGAHLSYHRAGIDTETRQTRLDAVVDTLVEASIPDTHKRASTSFAVDWTDHASWARPAGNDAVAADPDASWGHRNTNTPGTKDGLFFGYYGQAVTTVADEHGPPVPELIRRVVLHPCNIDPPTALVAVLQRMRDAGITIGDVLADSGYAHRVADRWATPLRRLGARLIQDLHPHDRGPKGTHQGAICCNGSLYCPATPTSLLQLEPLARGATADEITTYDTRTVELARYKLGRLTADDTDGYHRVGCPASAGKLRCPHKPASMTLGYDRPEIVTPPAGTAPCCTQTSITVPPTVNAKTRQKHDYPSRAHRLSYNRRSGAERSFSTLKDSATTDIRRGWCRLLGCTKNLIVLACAAVIRNLRILATFQHRQTDHGSSRRRTRRRTDTPSVS